jgi:hypothetical protein
MPFAVSSATAHEWATERSISLWVFFAGDLPRAQTDFLGPSLAAIRADGGQVAIIVSRDDAPSVAERALADFVAEGQPAPSPFAIFEALKAAHVADVRRVGILGSSPAAIEAGHRAGAGALVALAAPSTNARSPLLEAQPDFIVDAPAFGALDATRFSSTRAHRQRVLLNPGPSVVSDRVHRAVGGPDLCHREPEYSDLLERVRYPLRYDCQAATNRSWRSGRAKGRARGSNEGAGAPKVAASQALVR